MPRLREPHEWSYDTNLVYHGTKYDGGDGRLAVEIADLDRNERAAAIELYELRHQYSDLSWGSAGAGATRTADLILIHAFGGTTPPKRQAAP